MSVTPHTALPGPIKDILHCQPTHFKKIKWNAITVLKMTKINEKILSDTNEMSLIYKPPQ
jgi:hypothetical protein